MKTASITFLILLCSQVLFAQWLVSAASPYPCMPPLPHARPEEPNVAQLVPPAVFPYDRTGFLNFNLDKKHDQASVVILNQKNRIVREYLIEDPKEGSITIYGSTLAPGNYHCLLIIDEEIYDEVQLKVTH